MIVKTTTTKRTKTTIIPSPRTTTKLAEILTIIGLTSLKKTKTSTNEEKDKRTTTPQNANKIKYNQTQQKQYHEQQ